MKTIKDIAFIEPGYPFRGKIPEISGSRLTAVQMRDIKNQTDINWNDCIQTELTGKRLPTYLEVNDILFAARGSNNYAVLVDKTLKQKNIVAIAAPHFFVLTVKKETVLPEYLVWFLNQRPSQRYFEQNSEGSLTKSIRKTVLEKAPIAIPSLSEQKLIVELANVVKEERLSAEALIQNGQHLMNAIAKDLLVK